MDASDEGFESAIEIEQGFDGFPQRFPRCLDEAEYFHWKLTACVMVEGERKVVASCRLRGYEVLAVALKLPLPISFLHEFRGRSFLRCFFFLFCQFERYKKSWDGSDK